MTARPFIFSIALLVMLVYPLSSLAVDSVATTVIESDEDKLLAGNNPRFIPSQTKSPQRDDRGTLSLVWENDVFARTDRNYTNGVRVSYMSGTAPTDSLSRYVADKILGADDIAFVRQGWALGHSLFTPQDTQSFQLLPDQHPYGAWLYGEYSALIQQQDVLDQFTLQLGVVGPNAQGKGVQNNVHRLVGVDESNGWNNQIGNEIGVVISYDRKMRSFGSTGNGYDIDFTPNVGITLGNIYTNVRAGITLRFGQDLRSDFGVPRVQPSLAGPGYFTPQGDFSWYTFIGIEARAVAHNIFLDGGLGDDNDPSVDSKTWVGDVQAGIVAQFSGLHIALTIVNRTDEFETQQDSQLFGAFSISRKM